MSTVELRFSALPSHVRTARLVAAAVARRAGVDEAVLDEVRLAVGEACSRAVGLHRRARPNEPVTVTLIQESGRFTVEVTDCVPADDDFAAVQGAAGDAAALDRAVSDGAVSDGAVPDRAVPDRVVPARPVPGGAVAGGMVPGGVASGGVAPGGAVPGGGVPGREAPGREAPGGAVPGGSLPGNSGAGPGTADEAAAGASARSRDVVMTEEVDRLDDEAGELFDGSMGLAVISGLVDDLDVRYGSTGAVIRMSWPASPGGAGTQSGG